MPILRKILWGALVLVLLLLALNKGVNLWVDHKLPQLLTRENNTGYAVSYDSLDVNIWAGNAQLYGIRLRPKNANDSLHKLGIYAQIDRVEILGLKGWQMLWNDKVVARSLRIEKPQVVLYKKTDYAVNHPRNIGNEVVKPFNTVIKVSDLFLDKGDVKIVYVANNKPSFHAANVHLELTGIAVTDETLKQQIPFVYKSYAFGCDSLYLRQNAVYQLKAKNISTQPDGLKLRDLEFVPTMTRAQFVAQLDKEKDLYAVRAASLEIRNMDWGFKDEKLFCSADALALNRVDANIYRSKAPPDQPEKKKLYNSMLRNLGFPFRLDTLLLTRSKIVYEEELDPQRGPGKIHFDHFNLKALHLKSATGHQKMQDVAIRIDCRFMGTSAMKVNWNFNVLDKSDGFRIKGSILDFDTADLVPFTKNYSNMKQSGKFDSVRFDIYGNDEESKGNFALAYHDLKVTLYKKKDPAKKAKLKSAVANLLVKNDSDGKAKKTTVAVKRNPKTSFYNFFWRNIEQGLREVVL